LDLFPSDFGARSAVFFECPLCSDIFTDTQIWLSFRRDVGYDADLPPLFKNKVRVQ